MSSLFISDLHLTEERPEANERFIGFLEDKAREAGALYILGDFFEYWIGDDDVEQAFNAVIAGLLRDLSREVKLYLMHGNRDFLIAERFCGATGAQLLQDPTVADVEGVKTLLMHGDTLCTDDLDYQAWRRTARNPAFQADFLSKSIPERRRLILQMRERSKEVVQGKPAEIMDVNDEAVREVLRRHDVRRLIHGHTHRPGRHTIEVDGRRCERWVLPDWYGRGGYLEVARGAPRLVRF